MVQVLGLPGSRGGMGFSPSEIDALSIFDLLFWYRTHSDVKEEEIKRKGDA